jgi:hypothetical protein
MLQTPLAFDLLIALSTVRVEPAALAELLPSAVRWCPEACETSLFSQVATSYQGFEEPVFASWPVAIVRAAMRHSPVPGAFRIAAAFSQSQLHSLQPAGAVSERTEEEGQQLEATNEEEKEEEGGGEAGGQQAQHEQRLLEEAPTKETEAAAEAVERVWAELMADINWAGADQGQLWYIMRSVQGPGRYPSKVCAAAEQQLLRAFADTCSHLSKQLKDERRAAKESARLLVKADIRNAELEERVAQWQDHAQQYGAYEPRYGGGPLY